MFRAADGFFHFVFANIDDVYYTPDYLRIRFLPYLRMKLFQAGYCYVYILDEEQR
ncbi:MAG: hypothetical protein LUF89_07465 [Ruminococcus sp.]|nr:hypothetical protein [Ruminococcus sp.]